MSTTNKQEWADKYLLPASFGNTSLAEVFGVVFGEEPSEGAWFIEDNLYDENEGGLHEEDY